MNERRKSDGPVIPTKLSNKAVDADAEAVEERGPGKGSASSETRPGRRAGLSVSSDLDRVRRVARKDKDARFTALLHHVTVDRLEWAYRAIRPGAAPGVDGVTWKDYGCDLAENLRDLHARVHRGAYRARPSRRVYIPKPDGRQRPLGVAALEDKILQRAVAEVLNAIYECDFLGFSYGCRPGCSPHDALDALAVGIEKRRVNWILDADIRDYFSKLDHSWLEKFLEHRIADRRVLRLTQKWLRAGVIEDGDWSETLEGTPQGASISTLMANVYLHYVFDLWVHQWRGRQARGEMIVVRFADDGAPRTLKEDRCRTNRRMRCCTRDEGAGPVGLVALRSRPAGGGRKPPRGAPVKSRGAELAETACRQRVRCGSRRRAKAIPPMKCRKRIGDIRNRGRVVALGGAWREPADWPGGCPACRWRERDLGSRVERGNLSPRWGGLPVERSCPAAGRLEREPQAAGTVRGRVAMRGTGADLLVLAVKAL